VKRVRILSIVGIVLALGATEARAEIVYFSTGRTLSIKDHRADDDKLVLSLRAGGEIVCDPALIDRIVPDEVPYPEPEAEKPAVVAGAGEVR